MRYILSLLVVVAVAPLFAQTDKSIKPLPAEVPQGGTKAGTTSAAKATAVTRAVVIGISDYREPLIPDLRFADRDAEAFAHWLRDPEGCALPDSSIRLLSPTHRPPRPR